MKKEDVVLSRNRKVLAQSTTETNKTLKIDKLCDCDPYIMCMIFIHNFPFTAHCMDCDFVNFQTVICFK